MDAEMGDVVEPIRVLGARKERKHGEDIIQWLIQCKGKSVEEATWEDDFIMRSQFPAFSLENKTDFEGGGSDRAHEQRGHQGDQLLGQHSQGPRIWRVYSRKRRGTRGNQQVEETVMHSGEVVGLGAKARIENGRGGENVCVQNY
ncbi:hypothetical protein SESBI_37724 [Sesbania bispinosa]|nr:hypothetical protein SESBI_37724 [Sesbania bispinosa]